MARLDERKLGTRRRSKLRRAATTVQPD